MQVVKKNTLLLVFMVCHRFSNVKRSSYNNFYWLMFTPYPGSGVYSRTGQETEIHPEQITSPSKGKPCSLKPTAINLMFLFSDCVRISEYQENIFAGIRSTCIFYIERPEKEWRKGTQLQFGVCAKRWTIFFMHDSFIVQYPRMRWNM